MPSLEPVSNLPAAGAGKYHILGTSPKKNPLPAQAARARQAEGGQWGSGINQAPGCSVASRLGWSPSHVSPEPKADGKLTLNTGVTPDFSHLQAEMAAVWRGFRTIILDSDTSILCQKFPNPFLYLVITTRSHSCSHLDYFNTRFFYLDIVPSLSIFLDPGELFQGLDCLSIKHHSPFSTGHFSRQCKNTNYCFTDSRDSTYHGQKQHLSLPGA